MTPSLDTLRFAQRRASRRTGAAGVAPLDAPVARGAGAGTTPSRGSRRGFTFLELLIVMGLVAMLVGLTIGWLGNVGRTARAAQAAAIVTETAFRCQNASAGGGGGARALPLPHAAAGHPPRPGFRAGHPPLLHPHN
jgi:prepilin-type N-terminal cleavage/methylation domain-containing protein